MPIKIKNAGKLPTANDVETVDVLGLEIPISGSLPLGAQVQWTDTLNKYEAGDYGVIEFMLRAFCLYTWRCANKSDRVDYNWLSQQQLDEDEIKDLFEGVAKLNAAMLPDSGEKPKGKSRAKAVN